MNVEFINDEATYGPDIASYPIRITNSQKMDETIVVTNIGSSVIYEENITLLLVDFDNQVINQASNNQIRILSVTEKATLLSFDYVVLDNAQANFNNFQLVYEPGQNNIQYIATLELIDSKSLINKPTH